MPGLAASAEERGRRRVRSRAPTKERSDDDSTYVPAGVAEVVSNAETEAFAAL